MFSENVSDNSGAVTTDFNYNASAHLAVNNAPARRDNFVKTDFVYHSRNFRAIEV